MNSYQMQAQGHTSANNALIELNRSMNLELNNARPKPVQTNSTSHRNYNFKNVYQQNDNLRRATHTYLAAAKKNINYLKQTHSIVNYSE